MADLKPLTPDELERLGAFWRATHPDLILGQTLLAERVFGPPDATPDTCFCMTDSAGEISAVLLIVPPVPRHTDEADSVGGIRWLSVHPSHRGRDVGRFLLNFACDRLQSLGAAAVDFLATPPFYIRPGVDIRHTGVIAWLLQQGFHHERTLFNMTVDLATFEPPGEEAIFGADEAGYRIRRATSADRIPFAQYCLHQWTVNWGREASQGLNHDPVSLFLAVRSLSPESASTGGNGAGAEEIVGFAAYETSQLMGSFGPTGVTPEHRGRNLGKKLLWATLADMKDLGRPCSEIGWVGPVDFYYHAAGARLGPTFWQMRRRLL
jgi:GNAT superfamily N-acetyltransferase